MDSKTLDSIAMSTLATPSNILHDSTVPNAPKARKPAVRKRLGQSKKDVRLISPLDLIVLCAARASQPKTEEQKLQDTLDIILPAMGVNPRLLIKPPPSATQGKKRICQENTSDRPRKRARTAVPEEALDCPWPGCQSKGPAIELWAHLQDEHAQVGKHPSPLDRVVCGWDGCRIEGTSEEIIAHFEEQHNVGHTEDGTRGNEARDHRAADVERENAEGPAESAEPQDDRVVCGVADCNARMQRGRSFRRHAYGGHWHHSDYISWCEFCGKWKRRDQNCSWRAHHATCISDHLEEYGPQPVV